MELTLCIPLLSGVNKRAALKDSKSAFYITLISKSNKTGWRSEESPISHNDGPVLGSDSNVGVLVRTRSRMLFPLNPDNSILFLYSSIRLYKISTELTT